MRRITGLFALLSACGADPSVPFDGGGALGPAEQEVRAIAALEAAVGAEGVGAVVEFPVLKLRTDELDLTHVRVQQTVGGVPVFGGEAIVHLRADGATHAITDTLLRGVSVDPRPLYDADEAIEIAVTERSFGWGALTDDPAAELFVLRHAGADHLVWAVQLRRIDGSEGTSMPRIFIDAHTGAEVWRYDNLKTATGTTNYYGNVTFTTLLDAGSYYLEDTGRDLGTYTWGTTTSSLSYLTDADDVWTETAVRNGVDAHFGATATWDYYSTVHGRVGLDGAGGPFAVTSHANDFLTSSVSYSRRYNNAFWDGTMMVYGDGDGSTFGPLTTVDIAGHEMTHGVNEAEANFVYANESGALDEAGADIMGAMVERAIFGASADVWKVGEDAYTPAVAGDALRYMNNPTADGSSKDHYASRYTGTADNGGVHYNSGIGNLMFYLLAEGGAHPRLGGTPVTAIGADDAAAIWYRAVSTYMTSSTTFAQARTAMLNAATDLFGASSQEVTSVGEAWAAVGVGGSGGGTTPTCTTYTGSISRAGRSAYAPSSSGFSSAGGTLTGTLTGPSGANFDLFLQRLSGRSWSTVASSRTSTSTESLSYTAAAGTYRWAITSVSGTGSFSTCVVVR